MTPDEQKMLTDLANKIAQTPPPPKDAQAEELIRTRIGSRPDALYLMTQTVLIQNLALEQAQKQIQELQQRPQQPAQQGGGFLGQSYPPPQQYAAPQYAPPPPPQYAAPAPGGAPSFLRGAATTAAGVAAGALAFEGIRSLFEHPGYGGGLGGFGGGQGIMGAPVGETVVNNYYDSPQHDDQTTDTRDASYDLPQSDDTTQDDTADTQDVDYDDSNDTSSSDDTSFT